MASLLHQYDQLPDGFLDAEPRQLGRCLGGPSLIHLPGRRPQPLFISVLLHGNETTGILAIQDLLKQYQDTELPRSMSLFVGNVEAAADGLRRLAGQPDYNRVWPGSVHEDCPELRMMKEVCAIMKSRQPFASVDIHNNTGINPHYACVNRIDYRFIQLASLFSRTLVYFIKPEGVQSMAFAQLCPSITVECGKVGQGAGVSHARDFIDACLRLSEIPDHPPATHDVDLYHTVAIVKVPHSYSFGFGEQTVDICFVDDMDRLNFRELPAGTTLAQLDGVTDLPLEAWDESGVDRAEHYFRVKQDLLQTSKIFMPSMFTLDERVIRQDCLGYIMERYPLPG